MTPTASSSMRARLSGPVRRVTAKTAAPARTASAAARTSQPRAPRGRGAVASAGGAEAGGVGRGAGRALGVLAQHRVVQRAQLGAGLDADLARPARRAHAGRPRAPPPGGRSDTARACAGRAGARDSGCAATSASSSPSTSRCRPAARSASIASSVALQAQLLEPADLGGRERLAGDVGQRVAAPQRERVARVAVGAAGLLDERARSGRRRRVAVAGAARSRARGSRSPRRCRRTAAAAARRRAAPSSARVAGGSSPHRPSIRRSIDTVEFACSASIASSARCLVAPSGIGRPSNVASTGPSSWRSMLVNGPKAG